MNTQIDLLTKCLLSGELEKVKTIDNANLYNNHAFELHKDAKFLNNQEGF